MDCCFFSESSVACTNNRCTKNIELLDSEDVHIGSNLFQVRFTLELLRNSWIFSLKQNVLFDHERARISAQRSGAVTGPGTRTVTDTSGPRGQADLEALAPSGWLVPLSACPQTVRAREAHDRQEQRCRRPARARISSDHGHGSKLPGAHPTY
jgi:hypothetical protein